jgi:RimJ/RimL family protein N-acetyltransferase
MIWRMTETTNQYGQPVGPSLPDWTPRPRPPRVFLEGRYCRLEPLDPARHAADLFAANNEAPDGRLWTYLPTEPFAAFDSYRDWLDRMAVSEDPLFFALCDRADGKAAGLAAYLRIDPSMGSIEVGHLNFSPRLQKTRAATEAQFLLADNALAILGYRRYEWKCDSLNEPSRAAARRLGFTFEGVFRQAVVYKGRSRDTAWFSITDREWPAIRQAYLDWLAPENFDAEGHQRRKLSTLIESYSST